MSWVSALTFCWLWRQSRDEPVECLRAAPSLLHKVQPGSKLTLRLSPRPFSRNLSDLLVLSPSSPFTACSPAPVSPHLSLNLLTSRLFCVSPSPCVRPSGCSYIFCVSVQSWNSFLNRFVLFFFLLSSCMFVSLMSHRSHTLLCPILVSSFVSFLLKPFQRLCCNIFAPLLFLE